MSHGEEYRPCPGCDGAVESLTLKPGETLIIRVSDLTPTQVQQYQEHLEAVIEHAGLDVRVLVVMGDELAAQQNAADR